jgi:hypothetical protein
MDTLDVWAADFTGDGVVDVVALVGVPPSGLPTAIAMVEGIAPAKPTCSAPERQTRRASAHRSGTRARAPSARTTSCSASHAHRRRSWAFLLRQSAGAVRSLRQRGALRRWHDPPAAGARHQPERRGPASVPVRLERCERRQHLGFQFWYRDPAAGGAMFNASNAIQFVFVP